MLLVQVRVGYTTKSGNLIIVNTPADFSSGTLNPLGPFCKISRVVMPKGTPCWPELEPILSAFWDTNIYDDAKEDGGDQKSRLGHSFGPNDTSNRSSWSGCEGGED